MEKIKLILSVVLGITGTFFNKYGLIIALVAVALTMDFATGTIKSIIKGTLESKKSYKGIWKKVAFLLALFFGIFLDFFIPQILSLTLNIKLYFGMPFGLIMGSYIILNESISICENFYESGFKMPGFIVKMLKEASQKLSDDNFNGYDQNISSEDKER